MRKKVALFILFFSFCSLFQNEEQAVVSVVDTDKGKEAIAAGVEINQNKKGVFVSLSDIEKPNFVEIIKTYINLGFKIYSTEGTSKYLNQNGIETVLVGRADDIAPTSLTILEDKLISLVINTPTFANEYTDGWKIRRLSHEVGVAVVSSVREAEAFLMAFKEKDNILNKIFTAKGGS